MANEQSGERVLRSLTAAPLRGAPSPNVTLQRLGAGQHAGRLCGLTIPPVLGGAERRADDPRRDGDPRQTQRSPRAAGRGFWCMNVNGHAVERHLLPGADFGRLA